MKAVQIDMLPFFFLSGDCRRLVAVAKKVIESECYGSKSGGEFRWSIRQDGRFDKIDEEAAIEAMKGCQIRLDYGLNQESEEKCCSMACADFCDETETGVGELADTPLGGMATLASGCQVCRIDGMSDDEVVRVVEKFMEEI